MRQPRAVVVAHGEVDPADRARAEAADLLVAADGGALHLLGWGLTPHVVVGDLDSLDEATLERLARAGAAIERHPVDKDRSDLELAVARAMVAGAREVIVVGAFGGSRLDYTLANALLLADERWAGTPIRAVRGGTTIRALRGGGTLTLDGSRGAAVSLIPLGTDVTGIRTSGLRWALRGERLALGTSRGVSNVIDSPPASVSCESGALLVVEGA